MKKTFKILFIVMLALIVAFCTFGCNSDTYIIDDNGNRVKVSKIKFLHIWPEHSEKFTKIVNDFMAENEDIKIEIQVSSYEDITTYLNSQVISGTLPDIFFYWTNQVKGYADNGLVLDLSKYVADWKNTFINGGEAWDLAKIGGKYYNVPFRSTGNIIVYNKTLFDELGISQPADIIEFEEALKTLRAYSSKDSFSPLAVTGITTGTLVQIYTAFQNFVALQKESYKDPNYKKGILEMTEEAFVEEGRMLDKLKDWNSKKYFGNCEGKTEITAIRNFIEGNAGMVLMNNNNLYLLDDMDENIELGFMAIPGPSDIDYTYVYSDFDGFSVSNNTRYPEACIRFLKYLTSLNVQQDFADSEGSIMAVDGINYAGSQAQIAAAMKDAGNSLLAQTEREYSTSNISDSNVNLVLNYILNKTGSLPSGSSVSRAVYANYLDAIRDSGLDVVAYSIELKEADLSWLDIR
jgi:raffinose/stachyose/melibiose transport system substrate-binding protein